MWTHPFPVAGSGLRWGREVPGSKCEEPLTSGAGPELAGSWEWMLCYFLSLRHLLPLPHSWGPALCLVEKIERIIYFLCVFFKDSVFIILICITLIIWGKNSLLGNKLFCVVACNLQRAITCVIEVSHWPCEMNEATSILFFFFWGL